MRATRALRSTRLAVVSAALALAACGTHAPHWEVEKDAKPSQDHPLGGFWKSPACNEDDWGLAIGPAGPAKYYVSFCGPGGCFENGTYRPITTIEGDPKYHVVDANTIEVSGSQGFSRYVRCAGRAAGAPPVAAR